MNTILITDKYYKSGMFKEVQIKELLRNEYGLKNFVLENLNGYIDKIFLVKGDKKKFVLKVSMNRKMNNQLFNQQVDFINFLAKNKLGVPKIITTQNGSLISCVNDYRRRNCILSECITGKNFLVKTNKDLNNFIKWLIFIHKNCLGYHQGSKFYINPIKTEEEKSAIIKRYIRKSKKNYLLSLFRVRENIVKKYKCLISDLKVAVLVNDLHESNIKVRAGKKVILDFNISGKNYIVDELAWIINWYFIDKNRIDQIGKLLKIYQQSIPLNRSELNLLKELLILYSKLQYSDFKRIKDNRDLQNTFESIKKLHKKLKVQIK